MKSKVYLRMMTAIVAIVAIVAVVALVVMVAMNSKIKILKTKVMMMRT